jgi:hypothetical protein
MKDINAREIYADISDTLGADDIGYSTVTKHLKGKRFSKSMLDSDFELKIEEENFIDEAVLGALRNAPSPHSARLPKEYSFQQVRFDSFG